MSLPLARIVTRTNRTVAEANRRTSPRVVRDYPARLGVPKSLACTLSGDQVTVSPGYVRLHGGGNYEVPEQTVAISGVGSPSWVFVELDKAKTGIGTTGILKAQGTNPLSSGDILRLPLAVYEFVSGFWVLQQVAHDGDFNFDLPTL